MNREQMVERLLAQYPNLYVDYSWIIFDVVICPDGKPDPNWLAMTEKYSERICLGSDMVTKFERIAPEMFRYDVFLDQLSEKARADLCWNTAEKLYGGNKNRVTREGVPAIPAWKG